VGDGNSSSSSYKITINSSQHGRVTCGRTTAKAGEEITLNIEEDNGYSFDQITIRDKKGNNVNYTLSGGKAYTGGNGGHSPYYVTFTMPASDVTVSATFKVNGATIGVAINSTNFPDANFRSYIQNMFSGYSSLSSNQIQSVVEINVSNRSIRDLTGIKYFTSLQRLECDNNNISSLNLSSNTALVYLGCRHNNITNLVLPSSIVTLLCSYNKLTTLNIANLSKLNEIYCDNNNLTSLIVAGNKSVGLIHCYKNKLTTINLSGCTNMSWLACCCNLINGQGAANLVSNLPSSSYCTLDFFHTSDSSEGNSMTSSQVATANGRGWTVYQLYNNSYYTGTGNGTEYRGNDATSNYKITINSSQHGRVTCEKTTAKAGEKITLDIDEDSGYELDALTIRDKNGKTIDRVIDTTKPTTGGSFNYYWYATFTMPASDVTVTATFKSKTNGKAIKDYFPDNNFRNYILSLDIGKDGILTDGEIASLSTLNISNLGIESLKGIELFTSLQVLYCYGNKITSIDLSKLTLLRELYIYNNLLTSLDVSYCTRLTTLHCYNNRLTSLIITGCTSLKILYCYLNQLRGQAMTRIVNVLPYTSDGKIRMISISIDEGNSLDGVDTSGVGGRGWTIYDNNGNIYPSKIYVTNITIDIGGGFTISKGGTSILMLGEKEKFTAIVSPQNATYNKVTWSSSATNIVSVNDGYLEAKAVGEAKITVSANDGSGVSTYFYVKVQTPEEDEYRITINSSQHGSVTCEKTTAKAGEEIVLDIDEDSGYELNTLTIRDKNGNTIEREIKETRPITGGTFNYYRYATFTMPASDVTVSATFKAKESNGIPIIAAHFPDEIFRNYLLTLDCGIDGVLTEDEIMGVTELDVSEKNISDLTGIGLFTELKELSCYGNNLTSLDLSRNTKLTSISCGWNRLTSLDVSKNVALEYLWCENNRLTSLNVSNNKKLRILSCHDNQIKGEAMSTLVDSLPMNSSEYANSLVVYNTSGEDGNVITKLQVKIAKDKGWNTFNSIWEDYEGIDDDDKAPKIAQNYYLIGSPGEWSAESAKTQKFSHSDKDVSEDPVFTYTFYGTGGDMWFAFGDEEAINAVAEGTWDKLFGTTGANGDFSGSFDRRYNLGSDNSFHVDGQAKMYRFTVNMAEMTYEIKALGQSVSNATDINATNFPDANFRKYLLEQDYGKDGVLTDSEIKGVTKIDVSEKNISDLTGIGLFTELKELNCFNNNLTSLELSRNTKLTSISCGWNRLTSLDVSKNVALESLWCESNRLASLIVSNDATMLLTVVCHDNLIKGEAMSKLINSLPTTTVGFFMVHNTEGGEGNVITKSQVEIANEKGWCIQGSDWKGYEGIDDENKASERLVATAAAGYATFYDSKSAYTLPNGLSAQVVTGTSNGKLSYKTIADGSVSGVVPKGTAVMLVSDTKQSKTFKLTASESTQTYTGTNLLHGSDISTITTGDGYHYKLAYGKSGSKLSTEFGWYWGSTNGASFTIEGNKAWLVVPKNLATRGYSLDDATTGIEPITPQTDTDEYFDLQGRRISKPTSKGIYIKNGKKVTIK